MNSVVRILRKTESKLEKQIQAADAELSKIRAAIVALASGGKTGRKRRGMSKATRLKMAQSARLRWKKAGKKEQ